MVGVIFSLIAGIAMSLQGVMNTRLSEKIGLMESNIFVQGTALLLSLFALIVAGNGSFSALREVSWPYLMGGALGLVITVTVMLSIKGLSPTVAISVILTAQLAAAAAIDAFGILGTDKVPFGWWKVAGLALMVCGVLILKMK